MPASMPPPPPSVASAPQSASPSQAPLAQAPQGLAGDTSNDGSDQAQAVMMKVRDIHSGLTDLATQYPEFKQFASQAIDALTQGMVAVVGSLQRGTEVPAPRLSA